MRPSVLLIFAVASLGGCRHTWERRSGPTPEQRLDLYTTTATYLYEDGDLLRAQEQAVKALEIDPDNRAMRRMVGWIRIRLGTPRDLTIAEDFFRGLLADGDDSPTSVLGLAIACERLGTGYDRAADDLAEGRRPPGDDASPEAEAEQLRTRARAYWDEAIGRLEELLAQGEGSTDAMNALQRLYALRGDFENSLAWSERLIERAGRERELWRRLLTSRDLSEHEEEVYRTNEAKARDLATDTHLFAATLLYKEGRYEEALGHLDQAVDEDPDRPEVYSMRAQSLEKLGRYRQAIDDLDRFLSLSDAPFEHPDVRRAFELREACARRARATALPGGPSGS